MSLWNSATARFWQCVKSKKKRVRWGAPGLLSDVYGAVLDLDLSILACWAHISVLPLDDNLNFAGSTTYLLSPVDFAQNPGVLLQVIQKYKIKDTYATSQMINHAMSTPAKNFHLHEVKNIMIAFDQRPKTELCNFILMASFFNSR